MPCLPRAKHRAGLLCITVSPSSLLPKMRGSCSHRLQVLNQVLLQRTNRQTCDYKRGPRACQREGKTIDARTSNCWRCFEPPYWCLFSMQLLQTTVILLSALQTSSLLLWLWGFTYCYDAIERCHTPLHRLCWRSPEHYMWFSVCWKKVQSWLRNSRAIQILSL